MALVAIVVVVLGVLQIDETEVDTLPEFLPPIVEVQTEALGLSAGEVEQLITVPLEADLLNGVAWLESIRSESLPGLSSVVMTFEPGTDILQARQVVQERLTQAAGLPNVSRAPAMVQPLSSESRVLMVGMSSDEVSLIDMSVLARWTVRPFLMGVNGVANVSVWGQRERQLQVHVDQRDLAETDVTLLDVVKTTGNALWVSPLSYLEASTPGTGGFIDGPNQRIGIQHVLGIENPEDLASVTIEGHEEFTLGELTTVVEDHQPLIGDAVVDDGPGLLLVIEKFPWSNTVETTRAVDDALEELAPGLTGINLDTDIFRPADYIERSIDSAQIATFVGLALAIIAAFALLTGWRAALVGALSLIVSLVGIGLVLFLTNTEVNAMVFAGLVLATSFIIGDSIAGAEAVRRRLAARRDESGRTAIVEATTEHRVPLLYATAVLVLALVPTFAMEGAAGEFLPDAGLTMVAALAVAFIVGTTLTPALSAYLLEAPGPSGPERVEAAPNDSRLLAPVERGYERISETLNQSSWPALAGAVALLVIGAAIAPTLDREYIPEFEQTDLLIHLDGAPGTSLQASRRIATAAATEIKALPGVDDVGAHVGRAVLSDETVNVNSSELWVKIDPDASNSDTVVAIQEIVAGYPGYGEPGAVTYSNERINDVLRQPTQDLVVRVYGEDPAVLGPLANDIAQLVGSLEGTENVRALQPLLEPAIEIEVDLDRAAEFEVKPGDVRRTAATLLSGIEVGSFFEQQKVFEVVVWSPPETRSSVTSVEQLLITTPDGDLVELSQIADVRVAPVENVILRDAVSRYVDVVADVSGRSVGSVEDEITAAVRQQGLPFEYHVRILEDNNDASSNQREVIAISLAVAIAIFLVLQAAFSSWRRAVILFVSTPLALAGGLVALAISGGTYSIGSSIGLFAVYGITLRHSLTLIGRLDAMQLDDGVPFGPDLVSAALRERFTPALASFVAVALAMIPMIVMGQRAGLEVTRPLAIVTLGGLIGSALVTLFVLPAAYARFAGPAVPHESLTAAEGI